MKVIWQVCVPGCTYRHTHCVHTHNTSEGEKGTGARELAKELPKNLFSIYPISEMAEAKVGIAAFIQMPVLTITDR